MKTWKTLQKWLTGGCVYFTALSLLIILINLLMTENVDTKVISPVSFLLFFPCGLCMSAGGLLLRAKALPRWSRFLLHYIICVLAIFLMFYLPVSSHANAMTKLMMFITLSVLYWVLFGLIMLIYTRVRKLLAEED